MPSSSPHSERSDLPRRKRRPTWPVSSNVEIVTGERVVFEEQDVDMVVAPGGAGVLGILPEHAPLITTLSLGELRIKKGADEQSILVYGGFMEVGDNKVLMLADSAERAEEVDVERAEPPGAAPRSRSPVARARWTSRRRRPPCAAPISACGSGSGAARAERRFPAVRAFLVPGARSQVTVRSAPRPSADPHPRTLLPLEREKGTLGQWRVPSPVSTGRVPAPGGRAGRVRAGRRGRVSSLKAFRRFRVSSSLRAVALPADATPHWGGLIGNDDSSTTERDRS